MEKRTAQYNRRPLDNECMAVFIKKENVTRTGHHHAVPCDLCGDDNTYEFIHRCENSVYLCPACMQRMELLPVYSQLCIEQFLIGNVC